MTNKDNKGSSSNRPSASAGKQTRSKSPPSTQEIMEKLAAKTANLKLEVRRSTRLTPSDGRVAEMQASGKEVLRSSRLSTIREDQRKFLPTKTGQQQSRNQRPPSKPKPKSRSLSPPSSPSRFKRTKRKSSSLSPPSKPRRSKKNKDNQEGTSTSTSAGNGSSKKARKADEMDLD